MSQKAIDLLRDMFIESYEMMRKVKEEARTHYKYYSGEQLPNVVLEELKRRGQPEYWKNLYKMNLNKVIGYMVNDKRQVYVVGRQQVDVPLAEIMNDIIKYISECNNYNTARKGALENLALCGYTVFEVYPYKNSIDNQYDLKVIRIPYEEIYLDMFSRELDYSDAKYIHRAKWVDKEDLYRFFDKSKVDELVVNENWSEDISLNRDELTFGYREEKRERCLIVYTFYKDKDGKIKYAIWSDKTILEEGLSPYYRLNGFPFVVVKLRQNDNGDIYGWFRDIKPIQDALNFAMLRIQNMLGGHKIIVEEDAVDDFGVFKQQYSVDNGVVVVRAGSIMARKIMEINKVADIQGLLHLIQQYEKDSREVLGINEEVLGADLRAMSGEAIAKRQQVGFLTIADILDELLRLDRQVFGIVIDMVAMFYKTERVFAIADETNINGYKSVTINKTVYDIYGNPMAIVENDITIGKYDLIVDNRPPVLTAREKRFADGMQYLSIIAQIAPDVARKFLAMVLKDSDYTAKQEIIGMLDKSFQEVVLSEVARNPELLQQVIAMAQQMMAQQGRTSDVK